MLLTQRTCLAIVAFTLCAACGHAPAPVLVEPTAEEPETETAAQDTPDPACAEAVACEGEYESFGEILSGYEITSAEQLAELRQCRSISGDLVFLEQDWLTDIDLPCLTEVGGSLRIEYNPALTSLEGLRGITEVGGQLDIWDNAALTSLEGLQGITEVGGHLGILSNDALTSLEGLQSITRVGGGLSIRGHDALPEFNNLESLRAYLRTNAP